MDSLWLYQCGELPSYLVQAIPTVHEEFLEEPVVVMRSVEVATLRLLLLLPDG